MITKASSTVVVTSDVRDRVGEAIRFIRVKTDENRLAKLDKVQSKVDELKKRGLLRRQKYSAATASDFHKMCVRRG